MTRAETLIDENEAEQMHEAMDYAQHEKTWEGFINVVKWAIIQLVLIVLALYCFIEAGQTVLGGLLLLIAIVLPIGAAVRAALR